MVQRPIRNQWLLALCGALEALIAVIYFFMQGARGPVTFHGWNTAIVFLGRLTLAAGVCMIAAGIWRSPKSRSWLLLLNGLALTVLGVIYIFFIRFRISFRTIALLIMLMAISAGIYELTTARTLRRRVAGEWFLGAAGVVSFGFALVFFAFVFGWIKLEPGSPARTFFWLGSYFGFSAICMLGLALHRNGYTQRTLPAL